MQAAPLGCCGRNAAARCRAMLSPNSSQNKFANKKMNRDADTMYQSPSSRRLSTYRPHISESSTRTTLRTLLSHGFRLALVVLLHLAFVTLIPQFLTTSKGHYIPSLYLRGRASQAHRMRTARCFAPWPALKPVGMPGVAPGCTQGHPGQAHLGINLLEVVATCSS